MSDKDSRKREKRIERGKVIDCHCQAAETSYRHRQNKRSRGTQTMKQERDKSRQMYRRKRHEEIMRESVKKPARCTDKLLQDQDR